MNDRPEARSAREQAGRRTAGLLETAVSYTGSWSGDPGYRDPVPTRGRVTRACTDHGHHTKGRATHWDVRDFTGNRIPRAGGHSTAKPTPACRRGRAVMLALLPILGAGRLPLVQDGWPDCAGFGLIHRRKGNPQQRHLPWPAVQAAAPIGARRGSPAAWSQFACPGMLDQSWEWVRMFQATWAAGTGDTRSSRSDENGGRSRARCRSSTIIMERPEAGGYGAPPAHDDLGNRGGLF